MRGDLYYEERVGVAYEMLNRSVALYDELRLPTAKRRRLDDFTRRVMGVLLGERAEVPRNLRRFTRPLRRKS